MGDEIERKFLPVDLPNMRKCSLEEIAQGYLVMTEDASVRVRHKGDKYFLTFKTGKGRKRQELEPELAAGQFEELWPGTEGKRVVKTRYCVPEASHMVEVDVYHGRLEGLVLLEVEFPSEDDSNKFVPPAWFGIEVTDDPRFVNQNLAVNGIGRIAGLPKFTYDLDEGIWRTIQAIEGMRKANSPLIVSVAGGSASGKTSAVAVRLKENFDDAVIISMDDYYRGKAFMDAQAASGIQLNWDMPQAINLELLKEHLQLLKSGKPIQKPKYSFKTGESEGFEEVKPSPVIILEGLFTLDDLIAEEGDLRVFVDIGMHGRILRRLLRDITRTNQKPVDILSYFAEVVEPMHEQYVESTKKNADMVIQNEYRANVEAHRAGMYEVQLKFRAGLGEEDLRKAGAEKLTFTTQVDHYYNPKDRNLRDTDEMIRIREESGRMFLTYKGPRVDSEFRKRPKFEFEISEETAKSFLAVYGSCFKTIQKTRELYQLDGVIIALDDVSKTEGNDLRNIGRFLEVRSTANSEGRIQAAIAKLGLDKSARIQESYVEM